MSVSELLELIWMEVWLGVQNGRFTERSIARRLGWSQPHVHNVLARRRALTPDMADDLLELLGVSARDLVAGGGCPGCSRTAAAPVSVSRASLSSWSVRPTLQAVA